MSSPDDDPFGPTLLPGSAVTPESDGIGPVDEALAQTVAGSAASGLDTGGVDVSHLTPEQPGRYEMREEIGRGGMGRVILAFDEHLGREIAMKELHAQRTGSSSGADVSVGVVTRFLREARVTGQLEHPNIVPVHELGRRADGTLYYTMKRIRGRSLASVLATTKTLAERLDLLTHFRHVCEGMAYAHARGVVHRDLKPDNVMVGEFGETLIVDWGLSKVRGQDDPRAREVKRRVKVSATDDAASTIDGHAIGTPAYMSPEQARGELPAIDERSDVWGLGAMLFEILTGRPPHVGSKALEVLQKVLDERPPRVRDVEPDAPPELAAIADRALLRDASSRYPDAGVLAAEIVAYRDGHRVQAYEYSSFERVRRFVGRNRAASVAALVISLAVITATLVSFWGLQRESDARELAELRRDQAVEQHGEAERETRDVLLSLAQSLLEHAESALDDGDPNAAAIFAAGALLNDPANELSSEHEHAHLELTGDARRQANERIARAFSAYLDAQDARRFVFVRRVEGVSSQGALSPDGHTLVFPAGDRLAIESAEGGERRHLDIDADRVLGFLDASRVVLSGESPGVYALADGTLLFALPRGVRSAAILPHRFAIGGEDGAVLVFATDGYEPLGQLETAARGDVSVAWAHDGIVVGGQGRSGIELWPWPPAEPHASFDLPASLRVIRASPSGARIVVGLADPVIALLRPSPFDVERSIHAEGPVTGAAWLSDRILATVEGTDRVVMRNLDSRLRLDTLHVPPALAHRVESAGRRGLLVVLPVRNERSIVRASVFRFERHRTRRTRPLGESVMDVQGDQRRRRLLVVTLRSIEMFPMTRDGLGDRATIAPVPVELGHPMRIAVARDGAIAGVTDLGALFVVEPGAGEATTLVEGTERASCALGLAFGLAGDVIFFGGTDGRIRRWHRSRSEELAPLTGHEETVCGLSISSDGGLLASASLDGTARVFDVATSEEQQAIRRHDVRLSDIVFSPSADDIAFADDRGFINVVSRADGREQHRFRAHDGWIDRLAYSPDGLHIASAGDDRTVRYFEADGSRIVRILRTSGSPRCVAVSARGNFLYYQDASTVVRLASSPPVDARDPAALLRIAEGRAGLRLEGLELVPAN